MIRADRQRLQLALMELIDVEHFEICIAFFLGTSKAARSRSTMANGVFKQDTAPVRDQDPLHCRCSVIHRRSFSLVFFNLFGVKRDFH